MKPQFPYRYSILRYSHDVRTQEFLNVAVLFHSPEAKVLRFRSIHKSGRLSGMFPGVDAKCVIGALASMSEEFQRLSGPALHASIDEVRRSVLPKDDSSFQWAPVAGGLSSDLSASLESVFQRFVARYDRKYIKHVRSDSDVWQALRSELEQRRVLNRLHRAQISTPLQSYSFQHAWQNQCLHAIKPFSLDGSTKDEVAEKAAHGAGLLSDLRRSSEDFQLHLIVGKTQNHALRQSFQSARDLLIECADRSRTAIHDEAEVSALADQIARDVAQHGGEAV